jgi:putative copper export protein
MPGYVLSLLMRWVHISSMAMLIGGILYARLVLTRAGDVLAPEARESLADRAAALFRPMVWTAIAGLVLSGLYNYLTAPGHTPRYHMALGIKLLLAAHVFTTAVLLSRPRNPRRARMLTGAAISGLVIILISAYLRRIF